MEDRPIVEGGEEEEDGLEIEFTTFSAARLKMFSDAVWAIIATIMIVPTMHVTISEELAANATSITVTEIVHDTLPDIGLYFLAFLMICTTWACHVWTFQTMGKVTEFSILINLAVLLVGSFLPYFYSLMSRFRTWRTVIIFCSLDIAIGLLQALIILHAFSYPDLLSPKITELPDDEKKEHKRMLLRRVAVSPTFAFIAILLSFASPNAGIVCLAIIPVYPWVQSFFAWILSRVRVLIQMFGTKRHRVEKHILLTERLKMERIEAFSDGVFAITSTLLVLDISEKYIPTKAEVSEDFHGNLMSTLSSVGGVFASYAVAFMIIGNIWYAQLHLFKNFHRISRLMLFINNWLLACVGMIPLAFTFILHYQVKPALIVGVRFGCIVVFCASCFKMCLFKVGLLFDKYSRVRWVKMSAKPGGKDFNYICYQLVAPLILSVLVFGITYLPNRNISIYLGVASVALYTTSLVFWKTIHATFFSEDDHQDRYQQVPPPRGKTSGLDDEHEE